MTPAEKAAKLAEKIKRQVEKGAGKGLNAARLFLEARVKEEASVKAPTRMVQPRGGGPKYPVATTRATPGAPLRVVSGRFRGSLYATMLDENTGIIGSNARAPLRKRSFQIVASIAGVTRTDQGFNYPRYHEVDGYGGYEKAGGHKTFTPAIERNMDNLRRIVGGAVKAELA